MLLNPTLRDAGPLPGGAAHWTLSSLCQRTRIAAFGPAPARAREDFERWFEHTVAFTPGSLVLAFFDSAVEGLEDFEEGWTTAPFLSAHAEDMLAGCPFSPENIEDLESGWLSSAFVRLWSEIAAAVATFGSKPTEDFEAWVVAAVPVFAAAAFDGAAKMADTFDGAWPQMTMA